MRRYTISWIHKLPSRRMIQNDSMAISSVKYWNNLKLKQYNKLSLKGAISTNEIYVYSQASHLSFFFCVVCCAPVMGLQKKKKASNYLMILVINTLLFRLKRTSTKSRVLCGDKKGSKRKLYMGYVCPDTNWVFNTKVCFKKGVCVSLPSLADSDLWVHGGPAHPDPNFSQTCGLQVWSEKRELKPDDGDGHENGKKSNSFRLAEQKLCTFLCRRWRNLYSS